MAEKPFGISKSNWPSFQLPTTAPKAWSIAVNSLARVKTPEAHCLRGFDSTKKAEFLTPCFFPVLP
jgi:hypothetical protein